MFRFKHTIVFNSAPMESEKTPQHKSLKKCYIEEAKLGARRDCGKNRREENTDQHLHLTVFSLNNKMQISDKKKFSLRFLSMQYILFTKMF